MRLLTLGSDGSLGLTKDLFDDDVPPYAILSHTWGQDEQEVTIKDIREGTGRYKQGYSKIQFCSKQAMLDGLQYFWVDICCIDKSNSTELIEAINSMFRWYQNAERCYVYLLDVSKTYAVDVGEPLQLIAPSSVEFFTLEGQRLGNKEPLIELLQDITGISIGALQGIPLSSFSIAERPSWSEDRHAKKREDRAYSLLGIFGVSICPISGEGEAEAFRRLEAEIDQKFGNSFLKNLDIAAKAAFDSISEARNPVCLPDTRVDLLRKIRDWVVDPEAKAVFWLNGMAGTGKSTISRTLAHTFSDSELGASFFFKRGEGDRGVVSKLFTTITVHLVQRKPELRPYVKLAIDNKHRISETGLQEQFEKLILEPLSRISPSNPKENVLIIIDALDECEPEEEVDELISLLTRNASKSPRLRIFLTSRPEFVIRSGFENVRGTYEDLILHEVEEPILKHDLSVYFRHELLQIKEVYNNFVPPCRQLESGWPLQSDIQTLVEMATPLFIFAATACRFIANRRGSNPEERLQDILKYQVASRNDKLGATYLPTLDQLIAGLSDRTKTETLTLFKRVVGSIVLLATPLSTTALARLLDMSPIKIDNQLDFLHSVLIIKLDTPVQLLHLSFRDFLVDSERSGKNPFQVHKEQTHKQLVLDCLRVMNNTLRTDIRSLRWPGASYVSLDQQLVNGKLLPEVQYACLYWVYHLQHATDHVTDHIVDEVYAFLRQHFLHWLEALSLMGRALESITIIITLQSLLQVLHFVDDALRFVRANISAIQVAPLQTYCSALAFAPEKSIIRTTCQSIPDWISLGPKVDMHWGNCLQTLEGHTEGVTSVAFSPDSKIVVSGSWDGMVRLWSTATGKCLRVLKKHTGLVSSVAFPSEDGTVFASGSEDSTVRLWVKLHHVATGKRLQTFEGHLAKVTSIAFSRDSTLIASGSWDRTVRLWSATSRYSEALQCEARARAGRSLTYSPDGTTLLWSTTTGECLRMLRVHAYSIAFSPNSSLVALICRDRTVRVWSAATGRSFRSIECPSGIVWSIAFSPDGTTIAAGSWDGTVWLWSNAGKCLYTFVGHDTCVCCVSFSPDGTKVASGSEEGTVQLWSAATGKHLWTLKGHRIEVNSVVFSPDSAAVVSASQDGRLLLWSVATGRWLQTFEGHTSRINSVAFSPDGAAAASGSKDETIRPWSVATGCRLRLINLGTEPSNLSFSRDGQPLLSDIGTISLGDSFQQTLIPHSFSSEPSAIAPIRTLPDPDQNCHLRLRISCDKSWITYNGKNLLWLPLEYRPEISAVFGSSVAISNSARLIILQFSERLISTMA
ncbi:vegetative incompatibility protein HET-E-1 [Xylariaceae sp. FL1651]|nr:vegetative incompatibility protein HET-E-1 [Xylariaceae sp. FL1651]